MLHVEIESFGETIVKRSLARFGSNLLDWHDALDGVAAIMRESTEAQFDSEGAYASGGWPPLALSTIKKRHDDGHPILRVTDALHDSLTRKFDPMHVEEASRDALRFGSLVHYGVYHQSTRPRTKIPYRPPVALTRADKTRIVKHLQRAAVEGINA